MTPKIDYIAIDISKDALETRTGSRSLTLPYDARGLRKLDSLARKLPSAMVVCEATGGYERALMEHLHGRGTPVALLNPARVRCFARSEGVRAKSDPIDAGMIQRFAEQKRPEPTPAPSAEVRALADLMDRRAQLSSMAAEEKNRLGKSPRSMRASHRRTLRQLDRESAWVDARVAKLLEASPALKAQAQAMQQVVGVGEVTAWSVLAYLPELLELSRSQAVALAGLAPFDRDSGKRRGRRCIQAGRAKVRRCLYMAATSAATHNPVIRELVDRLKARGKPHKVAIVAAMRKMLIHLQSILRKQQKALA